MRVVQYTSRWRPVNEPIAIVIAPTAAWWARPDRTAQTWRIWPVSLGGKAPIATPADLVASQQLAPCPILAADARYCCHQDLAECAKSLGLDRTGRAEPEHLGYVRHREGQWFASRGKWWSRPIDCADGRSGGGTPPASIARSR